MAVVWWVLIAVGSAFLSAVFTALTVTLVKDRKDVDDVSSAVSGWSWYGRLSAALLPIIVGLFAFAFLAGCVAALSQVF